MDDFVPAVDALRKIGQNVASRWPSQPDEQHRLTPEAWPLLRPRFQLKSTDTVFTVGSCFARNIERYLDRYGLNVPMLNFSLPEGELVEARPQAIMNKYTPASIYQELKRTADLLDRPIKERRENYANLMLEVGDGVVDLELNGRGAVSMERALERREEVFQLFKHAFSADAVTITLGLVECWWDAERNMYVHPMPPVRELRRLTGRFMFKQMRYPEAYDYVSRSVELLNSTGKENKRILITTSPVPLNATFTDNDVIIANMYSKSLLRAVAGDVYRDFSNVDYFSSFESVMLSKSEGVWNKDLIHVSDAFVGKIVEHLLKYYLPDAANEAQVLSRAAALIKMGNKSEAGDILRGLQGSDPRARALLAFVEAERGGTAALSRLGELAQLAELECDEFSMIGQHLMEFKRYAPAAALFTKALLIEDAGQTDRIGLLLKLSQAKRHLEDLDGAYAAASDAQRISPNRHAVVRELVKLAVERKDHEAAVLYLDRILESGRFKKLTPSVQEQFLKLRASEAQLCKNAVTM
jgi:tetratricopeptide (TPR) repeat protein